MLPIFKFLVAALWLITGTSAQLNLYASGIFNDTVISSGCTSALKKAIACDPYLLELTTSDVFTSLGSSTLQNSVCTTSCGSSLSSYRNSVVTACKTDPTPWSGIPATWASDAVYSTYNRTCLKDTATGQYCTDFVSSISQTSDGSLTSLPKAQLCSPCILAILRQAQSTAFSNYSPLHVNDLVAIQKTCGVTIPTDVKPPVATLSGPNFANSTSTPSCLSGSTYVVQSGDNCQKIAAAKNIATGTLQSINNIYPDCSNLILGATLCLPQTCQTYLVKPGDTCWSIGSARGLTLTQLLAYNPTLNPSCTNLLSGINICVSPAAGTYTPTTIPGASVTKTDTYASSTIAPAGPTPFGTTPNCGKYYEVIPGDFCERVALNNSIAVPLFSAINPSTNAACDNLTPGLFYCVFPTKDWNSTVTTGPSVTIAPPAPTPSGTTGRCFAWHTVVSGDNCALIQAQAGISFAQLRAWNPQLNEGCTNLLLGDAYCVNGGSSSSSSSRSVSSTQKTVAPPAPTESGTVGACFVWHTVVSGDFCAKIQDQYGITFAQLRQWNKAIDSGCTNLLLGEAYCVKA